MFVLILLVLALVGAIALAYYFSRRWLSASQALQAQSTALGQLQAQADQAQALQTKLNAEETKSRQLEVQLAKTEETLRLHTQQAAQQEAQQKQAEQRFENLANKIFTEKTQQFSQSSQQNLDLLLKPFKEQLTQFQTKVELSQKESHDGRTQLFEQIKFLKEQNLQISQEAKNLTQALRGDNKAQGNWGEMKLEKILEASGLQKGLEYELQESHKNEEGRTKIPDAVVHLPNDKVIIIDAKVNLVHWEGFVACEEASQKELLWQQHIQALKNQIKSLSQDRYDQLPGLRSLDFVLLFIPIEASYIAALERERDLFAQALQQSIVLCSPSTLMVMLRTIENIWRVERQNQFAKEIAKEAGAMVDKFAGFLEDMESIGKHLNKTQEAHAEALKKLSTGRGNLVTRATKLKQMGAESKKALPLAELEEAEE